MQHGTTMKITNLFVDAYFRHGCGKFGNSPHCHSHFYQTSIF